MKHSHLLLYCTGEWDVAVQQIAQFVCPPVYRDQRRLSAVSFSDGGPRLHQPYWKHKVILAMPAARASAVHRAPAPRTLGIYQTNQPKRT
jgi:hypothetical protein